MNVKESEFKTLLEKYKSITVYGLSPDVSKPSHQIPLYMKNHGYDVVGVYPRGNETAGMRIYTKLSKVPPDQRKFVDVFRSPENIPEVVDEVLEVGGVEVLWLQLGITNPEAEARAEKAGIKVVSNRCLLVEHRKYLK